MSTTRTGLATLALISAFVLSAAPAAAHTDIESTVPADGEILTELPDRFVVTATEELNDITGAGDGFGLHVLDPDGTRIDGGALEIEGRSVSIPAVVGEPGTHTLAYQVVSADGHPISGSIQFVWAPDGVVPEESSTNAPDATASDADAEQWPASVLPVGIAAAVVLAGVVVGVVLSRRRSG